MVRSGCLTAPKTMTKRMNYILIGIRLLNGHCICTGLGLGVRENWILNKPGVTKVTVVEKNQEIIDYHKFINPRLFDDVEVIHCDANEYKGKIVTPSY